MSLAVIEYVINGQRVTKEEFEEMQKDPNIKLKLVEGTMNEYRVLEKMYG